MVGYEDLRPDHLGYGRLLRQAAHESSVSEASLREQGRAETPRVAGGPRRIAGVGNVDMVKFRGWLIEDMVAQGHTGFACGPELGETDRNRLAKAGAHYQRIRLERTGVNLLQDLSHVSRLAAPLRRLKIVVLAHTQTPMVLRCLAAKLARVLRIFAIVEGLGYAFTPGRERKRRIVRAVLGPALKPRSPSATVCSC